MFVYFKITELFEVAELGGTLCIISNVCWLLACLVSDHLLLLREYEPHGTIQGVQKELWSSFSNTLYL
jgi:hypothetical protein